MVPTLKLALVGLLGAAAVQAIPDSVPELDVIATSTLEERASTCTFSGSKGAASAIKSKTSCSTIVLSSVAVPAGTTLDLTGLKKGTTVIFEGETTFGYKEWSGPLVSVSGTDITVKGASGSVLNGDGARWWDGKGTNGGKTKPKFFYAHKMINSKIENISIKNSPVQVFSINGANALTLDGITVNNADGDSKGGHNTDAFDIGSSTGVYITNPIVHNQDDCLAVNSGTDISFTGAQCTGGHGISIGSVGGRSDNAVNKVTIENCTIKNSQNGVRVKTVYGATGSVKGVTYKDITLSGISKYGVVIEQDYKNGSPTGNPTNGVPITGLTLSNVKGTVDSSATNVYILCASGACSGWTWNGVSVKGGKTSSKCKNVPGNAKC
ncbi:Polygalacturonase [Penicillium cataractarum]|uniref:endo-polygalacturonase n=1 Tax=Penicillium cataractarum TaxID=2100454 RepID=A0A9W9RND0_9EURO|nr:Polygalacturonase [Penicillium cataractarum]KAJ5363421.1 Polygalacturonase [Penicillium cataractarum]